MFLFFLELVLKIGFVAGFLFQDDMPVSFKSDLFQSHIWTIFK